MRFRTQQVGLALIGLTLQGYLIWQWKAFEAGPIEPSREPFPMLEAVVGYIYVFVAFRAIAWALWSPDRSRFAREHFGLSEANVIRGRFRAILQWFLHLDEQGKDRDA
jgi:cytochrome b